MDFNEQKRIAQLNIEVGILNSNRNDCIKRLREMLPEHLEVFEDGFNVCICGEEEYSALCTYYTYRFISDEDIDLIRESISKLPNYEENFNGDGHIRFEHEVDNDGPDRSYFIRMPSLAYNISDEEATEIILGERIKKKEEIERNMNKLLFELYDIQKDIEFLTK